MTKKRYRFGLVGCGNAGQNHLKQMLTVPEIEVAAVAGWQSCWKCVFLP